MVEVISPESGYDFEWNTGSDQMQLEGLSAGTYQAFASLGDCSAFIEVVLDDPEPLSIAFTNVIADDCEETNTGGLTIVPLGGTPPYQVFYQGNQLAQLSFANLAGGNYTVSAVDANGCTTENEVFIETVGCDTLQTTAVLPQYCGDTNLLISDFIQAGPVSEAISYAWEFSVAGTLHTVIETDDNTLSPANHPLLVGEQSYTVRVRGINPEIPSVFGTECELSFVLPQPNIDANNCAVGEIELGNTISADPIDLGVSYEFRFEDIHSGERSYLYSDSPQAIVPEDGEITPGLTYEVAARINHRGVWGGYGDACLITITAPPATTSLTEPFCGNLEVHPENDIVLLQPIENAIVYQTIFTDDSGMLIDTVETETAEITGEALENMDKSLVYETRSRALVFDEWTPWGPACTIGFKQTLNTLNLSIYPNPILAGANLQAKTEGNFKNVLVEVKDLSGRPLNSFRMDFMDGESQTLFEIPRQRLGVYLIQITHGKQRLTKKLIVQ
jgi:hypothetical protein